MMNRNLPPAEQRVVLRNIRWPTYEALLADRGDHGGRIAYDRGVLEIMSPSLDHENLKTLIGRLIETLTEELEIRVKSAGSLTLKRKKLKRGVEPDECYYIANEPAVRDLKEIDLARDPPPDLAVEVDVSGRSVFRLEIYAALGIPEVWRLEGEELIVYRLQGGGSYRAVERSAIFPMVPLEELVRFIRQRGAVDETSLVRSFRAWVRDRLIPRRSG